MFGNLKSENSQNNAQKPQRNCMFMNSASGAIEDFIGDEWQAVKIFALLDGYWVSG